MPAVSKGDGMRGLAVFISDIRNCEWRLRRGGAGAWAGPAVAVGRCPVGPGLLSFDPLLNARLFPLLPPQQAARSAPASRNGDAPWGAAGEAARGGGGGGGEQPKPSGLWVWVGLCILGGLVRVSSSLPSPRRCGGVLGVVVAAPVEGGAGRLVPAVVFVYKAKPVCARGAGGFVVGRREASGLLPNP